MARVRGGPETSVAGMGSDAWSVCGLATGHAIHIRARMATAARIRINVRGFMTVLLPFRLGTESGSFNEGGQTQAPALPG